MAGACLICSLAGWKQATFRIPKSNADTASAKSFEPSEAFRTPAIESFWTLPRVALSGKQKRQSGNRGGWTADWTGVGNGGMKAGLFLRKEVPKGLLLHNGAPLHRTAAREYTQDGGVLRNRIGPRLGGCRLSGEGPPLIAVASGSLCLVRCLAPLSLVKKLSKKAPSKSQRRLGTVRSNGSDSVETAAEPASKSLKPVVDESFGETKSTPPESASNAGPSGNSSESESIERTRDGSLDNEGPEENGASTSNGGSHNQEKEESTSGYRRETILPHRQLREEVKGRRSTKPWRPSKPERKSVSHVLSEAHYKNQGGATQDLHNEKFGVTLYLRPRSTGCVTWIMRALDAHPKEGKLDDLLDTMLEEAPVSISDMGGVLKVLKEQRRWKRLLQVLEYMESRDFALASYYHIAIDALGSCRRYKEAVDLFRSKKCPKNQFTYNCIMQSYARRGDIEGAEKILEEMRKEGIPIGPRTYNVFIESYTKQRGGFEKAVALYRQMLSEGISPDVITYTMLISACGKMDRNLPEEALAFFKDMKDRPVEPDLPVYNALINTLGKAGMCDEAAAVLEGMEQTTWRPNIVTYTAIIDAFSRRGRWEEAAEMMERMKKEGKRPNVVTYTCLLNAYGMAKLMDKAEEVIEEMKRAGLYPNIMTWTSLLFHYGQAGLLEETKDVLMRMEDAGCRPNQATYTALIKAFMKAARYEDVLSIFEAMKQDFVQPDEVSYLCILRALVDSGASEQVPQVYEELLKAKIKPGAKVELVRTEAYFKMNRVEEAMAIFAAIPDPDKIAYDQYINLLAKAGRSEDARKALEDMKARGIQISHYAYSGVILAYCNGGGDDGVLRKERIMEILKEMRDLEVQPSADVYNIIINAFSVRNMYSEAEEMYQHMQENKVEPDAITFETLMGMYCEMHDYKQALGVFRWMTAVGYLPSTYAFFLLVRACELAGSRGARPHIFDILEDHDITVDVTFVDMLAESLWWHRGRRQTVLDILETARNVGLYPATHAETPDEWTLVLDTSSEGTCQGMALVWLAEIRLAFEQKERGPKRYTVTVNTHGLSGSLSGLPIGLRAVKEVLDSMGSPFLLWEPIAEENKSNVLRLVAEAPAVHRWLIQPEVKVKLINPEADARDS